MLPIYNNDKQDIIIFYYDNGNITTQDGELSSGIVNRVNPTIGPNSPLNNSLQSNQEIIYRSYSGNGYGDLSAENRRIVTDIHRKYFSYGSTKLHVVVKTVEVSKEKIHINDWLYGYAEPSGNNCRIFTPLDFTTLKNDAGILGSVDWYSFEPAFGSTKINSYFNINTNEIKTGENLAIIDNNERYWVAVGPKILNENYPDNGEVKAHEFTNLGIRLDKKLDIKVTNGTQTLFIYARVGDLKAHTYIYDGHIIMDIIKQELLIPEV